jgi:hypothetical protein
MANDIILIQAAGLNDLVVEFNGRLWALHFGSAAYLYCSDYDVKQPYLSVKLSFHKNLEIPVCYCVYVFST